MGAFVRGAIVMLSVIVLGTIGLNAFDNTGAPGRSLLGAVSGALAPEPCPSDMVLVRASGGDFCIDRYEAAPGDDCPHQNPSSKRQTDDNLTLRSCGAVSEAGRLPWRNIARQQAELACTRSGKRLPTNSEWYRAALGTPDRAGTWGPEDCNLASRENSPSETGDRPLCVSVAGAFDMVGNVWEWLEETVDEGTYANEALPPQGYIAEIDAAGLPTRTEEAAPDAAYFDDYFWLEPTGVRGMIRGGFWRSQTDGGQYALNVSVPPSFTGDAIGFRCAKAIE